MNTECSNYFKSATLLSLLLIGILALSGCTNSEKAKAAHLSKGEAYLKESKFQEAALEFRNAIQIDDKLGVAYWGLARAYEGLQRGQESFEANKKAVELDPNNLDARVKLGTIYVQISYGKPEFLAEAERLAKEVVQKNPNHIEAHILTASVLFAKNQRDQALVELNRAIELDPKRTESYMSLAKFYVVTNDPAQAEDVFKRAISINGSSALGHTEYGKFLVQRNRAPEAEAEFEKAVQVEPSYRTARHILASFYLVNGRLDKAEAEFRALADLDKDRPQGQAILADFYAAINRVDDAVSIYKDILSKSPDFHQGRYRLAEIMLQRGDTQGATAQIDEVLKRDEHDRQALLMRARLRSQTGNTSELKSAIEDLKEVLRQEPNSKAGLYFMAQANFSLGSIDQARAFAADLERNYPDYLPGKLLQAQLSLAAGDSKGGLAQSSDLLSRLMKAAPDTENSAQLLAELRVRTYIVRGAAYAKLGNNAAARKDFETGREIGPRNSDVYINLAAVAMAENKPEEAAGFYENALSIAATDFGALHGLIQIYARRNELNKAHARLDQVLSAYPNDASLHYLKAEVYGIERNQQGVENELRKALELDSNYVTAYLALGALFINTKQDERAIAEYKKIAELNPDNPTPFTIIGMLYDARKDYPTAAENYRKALEKDQNAMIAANNLAWLYADRPEVNGNLDEAVRLAQGVVQKNANVAGFLDTLGWVYYKKGLQAVAIEQLQKAVSLDEAAAKTANVSPSPTYRYHLGMALKAKGDKEGARRELGVALKLAEKVPFPDADEARKALATL